MISELVCDVIYILYCIFILFFVCHCFIILQSTLLISSLIVCRILFFFISFRFSLDGKPSSSSEYGYYGLIALLLIPLSVGATWYYCCCKRQTQTPEINPEEQRVRQVPEQVMENADTQFRTEIQSVTVAEEIMQDQQIEADDHVPIVSSAYVYQTGIILTDEEIALHSTAPLCSAQIVL